MVFRGELRAVSLPLPYKCSCDDISALCYKHLSFCLQIIEKYGTYVLMNRSRLQRIKDILHRKDVPSLEYGSKPSPIIPTQTDHERIESLALPNAGQSFNGNDFRDLLRPGVYVAMLGELPLYAGMSNQLLRRVGGSHKQASAAFAECDRVLLYPCASVEAARELEAILLSRLQPKYNVRLRSSRKIMKALGICEGHANTLARI